MEKKLLYKKYNSKKGLSAIITTLLLVMLVLVAVGIVWGIVNNMLKGQMEGAEACFGNYDKVTINSLYTCYDSTNEKFHFSLSIEDIDVEKVVVAVSSEGSTNSYTLTNEDQQDIGLTLYPSGGEVKLPAKNGGKTYIASGFTEKPDLIQIAPVINEQQCDVSDSLSGIEICF